MSTCAPEKDSHNICKNCGVEIRNSIRVFGDTTSLHGINHITKQNVSIFERCCWTVIMLVSAILCGREISKLYRRWEQSPVITSFAQHSTPTSDVPFPAVTICPQSKVLRSVIDVEEKFDYLRNQLNGTIDYANDTERLLVETVSIICDSEPALPSNFIHTKEHSFFIFKIAPNLSDVFVKCSFEKKAYPCSDLFRPIITEDGLCFTFNMLPSEEIFSENYDGIELPQRDYLLGLNRSSWTLANGYESSGTGNDDLDQQFPWREKIHLGPLSGLEVLLKVKIGESQHICSNHNADNFKVTLHSPVEYPLPTLSYFHVSPESQAMVSVTPERIEADPALHPPHYKPQVRGCVFPEERTGLLFKNLTEHNCLLDAKAQAAIWDCNCTFFDIPVRSDADNNPLKYCNDSCQKGSLSPTLKKVIKKCLPSCHELSYAYHVSNSKFESVKMRHHPQNQNNLYTKIKIFYGNGRFFALRKSERYGISDFIANCGGLLSLCTGFSVITAMEICYFVFLLLICQICRVYKRH